MLPLLARWRWRRRAERLVRSAQSAQFYKFTLLICVARGACFLAGKACSGECRSNDVFLNYSVVLLENRGLSRGVFRNWTPSGANGAQMVRKWSASGLKRRQFAHPSMDRKVSFGGSAGRKRPLAWGASGNRPGLCLAERAGWRLGSPRNFKAPRQGWGSQRSQARSE